MFPLNATRSRPHLKQKQQTSMSTWRVELSQIYASLPHSCVIKYNYWPPVIFVCLFLFDYLSSTGTDFKPINVVVILGLRKILTKIHIIEVPQLKTTTTHQEWIIFLNRVFSLSLKIVFIYLNSKEQSIRTKLSIFKLVRTLT